MPNNLLEFEKPLLELENKINELRTFSAEKGIDLTLEIETLESKALRLKQEIYANLTPWQRVMIARHSDRPNVNDYIRMIIEGFIEFHGDRTVGDDPAIVGGIGKLGGRPVTVIGEAKGRDTKENLARNFGMPHPEGYRKALRLMKQADKFGRPIICIIDTPGAFCGISAEERGVGEAIARNLMEMMNLKVPVVSVVIGEGGSGGALALGVANRVIMLENSVYSVISPESFGSIIWKDASRASEAASLLRLTSADLKEFGVIEEIVPEPLGGAHKNPGEAADNLKQALIRNLAELSALPGEELATGRYEKFRRIGKIAQG